MNIGRFGVSSRARSIWVIITSLLLFSVILPATSSDYIYPYDPLEHSFLEEVASWKHPDGEGADLAFNYSSDCSRLVLIGYAAPDEVRVTDRNLSTIAVLEPPGEPFEAKGARWSNTDRWVVVWGHVTGVDRDVLAVYDGTTCEPVDNAPWTDLVDLAVIDSLCFFADDYILMVGGRNEQGTSLLITLETFNEDIRSIHEWPGNHSILHLGTDSRQITLVDSGGTITHYSTKEWRFEESFEGVLSGPTAWCIQWEHPWAFGDAEGLAVLASDYTWYPQCNVTVGDGPVKGISWTFHRLLDFIIATGRPEGGSTLSAWQLLDEVFEPNIQRLCSLDVDGNVTMMEPDPGRADRVVVAFGDGTLAVYRLDVNPRPIVIQPGQPDLPDGNGLETIMLWRHPRGEAQSMAFSFNHKGSLIVLRDELEPSSLWVVNRSFDTVGTIELGEDFSSFHYKWSSTDSWLVVWGIGTIDDLCTVSVYDSPTLAKNTSLGIEWILEHVHGIQGLEFLPGDRVLAVSGANATEQPSVMFFDLKDRKLLRECSGGDMALYNALEIIGDSLMCLSEGGEYATFSLDSYELLSEGSGPFVGYDLYDHFGDAWLFKMDANNLSYFEGDPGSHAWTWWDQTAHLRGAAWTHVQEGDLVLSLSHFKSFNPEVYLWRDVGKQGREGMRLVSILKTSFDVVQLAADPAYPGLMAASTDDGHFLLYHVNVSGYPPVPTKIGDVPINGSIDWWGDEGDENVTDSNGNNTGDGSQDLWGTSPPTLLVGGLIVAMVALLATYVWVRKRGSGEG